MGTKTLRHPEAREKEIRKRVEARRRPVETWSNDYGWIVRLYDGDKRGFRDLPPGSTIADARRVAHEALKNGDYEKAWIEKKRR